LIQRRPVVQGHGAQDGHELPKQQRLSRPAFSRPPQPPRPAVTIIMMSLASHVLAQLALPPLPAPPPPRAAARLPKFHVAGALCRRASSRPASFWVYGPPTRRDCSASSCLYAASNWLCAASRPVFDTVTFCAINVSGSILRSTIPLLARRRARAGQARPRTRLCASKPCSSRSLIPMISSCQVERVPCLFTIYLFTYRRWDTKKQ
jgi:hypothetical protein